MRQHVLPLFNVTDDTEVAASVLLVDTDITGLGVTDIGVAADPLDAASTISGDLFVSAAPAADPLEIGAEILGGLRVTGAVYASGNPLEVSVELVAIGAGTSVDLEVPATELDAVIALSGFVATDSAVGALPLSIATTLSATTELVNTANIVDPDLRSITECQAFDSVTICRSFVSLTTRKTYH